MASAGDVSGAQAAAATLAPFWDEALHTRTPEERGRGSGLFDKALPAADAVADPGTGAMLLRPFRIENLTGASVDAFGKIAHGRVRSAVDDGIAADMVRRGPANVGIWQGTGTAPVGGGLAAQPVPGSARHERCWRGGRAAAP
jgi:hypothetical protein